MPKIKVGDKGTAYFPDDLREKGYVGELEAIPNACLVVIPKPGAKNKDIAKSLEILAQDFKHRAQIAEEAEEESQSEPRHSSEDDDKAQ